MTPLFAILQPKHRITTDVACLCCQLPAEIMITKDTTLINYFIQRSYYTKHSRNLRAPILTAARSTKMTSQLSFHGRVSHRSLYVYLVSLALLQKECTFDFGQPFSHGCIWIHLNIFIHIATHIDLFYSFPPQWKKQKMARSTHPQQGLPSLHHPSSVLNTVVVPTPVLSRTSSVHPDALFQGRDQPSPTSVAYHPTYFGVTGLTGQQCLPCEYDYPDADVVPPDAVVVPRPFRLAPRSNEDEGPPSPIPKRNKKSPSPTQAKDGKYKTEWCKNLRDKGFCGYGAGCIYVHRVSEFRSTGVMPSLPCVTAVSTGFW